MSPNVYIWKYRAVNPDGYLNYFTGSANLMLDDKIDVSGGIMEMPLYDERYEKAGEVLEFKASDFVIKTSLLAECLSVQCKSTREFLLGTGNTGCMFVCVVEFGSPRDPYTKRIIGKIEPNSIEANYTVTENRFDLSFKCTGLLRELTDYLNQKPLPQVNSLTYLDEYLTYYVLNIPGTSYYTASENLHLDQKIGFRPRLIYEMYNDILSRNDMPGCWDAFKEILRGLGFMFRFGTSAYPGFFELDYPPVYLDCYWRSEGTLREVEIISEVEKYSDLSADKNYLLLLYRSNVLGHSDEYAGMLKDSRGNTYIADNFAGNVFEEIKINANGIVNVILNGPTPPPVWKGNCTVIELPTYETAYKVCYEEDDLNFVSAKQSLSSCFSRLYYNHSDPLHQVYKIAVFGVKTLLLVTSNNSYDYLVSGRSRKLDLEIIFDLYSKVSIGDIFSKFMDHSKQIKERFWLLSIDDINLTNSRAITHWIEC